MYYSHLSIKLSLKKWLRANKLYTRPQTTTLYDPSGFIQQSILCYSVSHNVAKRESNITRQPDYLKFLLNTLTPEPNGWHFADNIFKCIFLNENWYSFIEIVLHFVLMSVTDDESAFVKRMAMTMYILTVNRTMHLKIYTDKWWVFSLALLAAPTSTVLTT